MNSAPSPAAGARLLLIDDDRKLARMLAEFLQSHGFTVDLAHDGREGIERAGSQAWDLILLDVMLPQLNGFDVLRQLRALSQVPVLMLTARGGDEDRIHGLEGGADDYVPKTASARELLARIRAVLRRVAPAAAEAPREILLGALKIEPAARAAALHGVSLGLTPVEFDLLLALARSKGRVCSREQLMEQVRDRQFDVFDRSIDVHVASLRRKLGDDPRAPRYIRTVRAAGYLLLDPAQASAAGGLPESGSA